MSTQKIERHRFLSYLIKFVSKPFRKILYFSSIRFTHTVGHWLFFIPEIKNTYLLPI